MSAGPIVLVVPYGKRPLRIEMPVETARWLRDQISEAIGAPRPKRQPRLRRGRWQSQRKSR